jgi:hypothetical protein
LSTPDVQIKQECRGKIQEIGNLNVVFNKLAKEGVKLVNIGPEDIWDGNPNLLLGFFWTLIYHFQVPCRAVFWATCPSVVPGKHVLLLPDIDERFPAVYHMFFHITCPLGPGPCSNAPLLK